MTRVGDISGLPALRPGDPGVQVADNGQSLVLDYGDRRRRFFVAGSNGQAAPPQAVDPELIKVSRTGTYELRSEPRVGADQSNRASDTIHLIRASSDAEKPVVRHIAAADGYQFSGDESLLATWSQRGLQIVRTGSADVVVSMKIDDVGGVEFLGRNAVVSVTSRDKITGGNKIMLVPIDHALILRFATWLNPRPVTAEERCLYGLPGAECR